MEVVLLGTGGGGWLNPSRRGIAQVVVAGGEALLFDCGEGATRQLYRAGIHPTEIRHLFFTHHHFDHDTDYPYFALSTWLMGRDTGLRVYGPRGTARMTRLLFGKEGVFQQDQTARTGLSASLAVMQSRTKRKQSWIDIDVKEIESSGLVCLAGKYRVRATFTQHIEPYMETVAYRVDTDEGSIAIAVDSSPTQAVADLARGADILVHECSATEEFIERLDLQSHHSGPQGVARVAKEANVRKLVVVHFLPDMDNPVAALSMEQEIRDTFSGEVFMGEDLLRIVV